ncbi:TetR/AcrR family transcriptional regulator [Saccharopolyspora karakumensis]|uniref:TetR/AcrR family transcriptional regulator n=1 Tax=Saccharopolyspora karakumensis TaxID=2530386 RepID=A0A4R5BVQ0_9PSEU|nr:TetR/AcrR family transcriptional regulator [Saccharopolyspora karakumensis]TDD89420.1 TetR/AcrR family transcriptional regulator [Saccharopolyspora karakumensis]
MGRKKVYDETLRLRLLDRAGELLTEGGSDALSLRDLAKSAGTSTSAVYSLFGGKPDLLRALYIEGFRRLSRRLRSVDPDPDPVEELVQLAHAYRSSALADPNYYRAIFGRGHDDQDQEVATAGAGAFGPLLEAVQRGISAGKLVDEDPMAIASALWALVHGLVTLELSDLLRHEAEGFDYAARAALRGWRTDTAAR